ncbi:hypothetical protein ACWODI_06435 [Facklamia languida]
MKRFWKYLTVSLLSISLTTPIISNSQDQRTLNAVEETAVEAHVQKVLDELQAYFPNEALPHFIQTPEMPGYLSAATTETTDINNFKILYYSEEDPISVNDPILNQKLPIASFQRIEYDNEEMAIAAIKQIKDFNGEPIDLGHGITGYQSGAMGSSYLDWMEGNWSLNIRAANQEGKDPTHLGKEVVSYLEKFLLPAPETAGQINLKLKDNQSFEENVAAWQIGKVVYITTHKDPFTLIQMTTSITQPSQ